MTTNDTPRRPHRRTRPTVELQAENAELKAENARLQAELASAGDDDSLRHANGAVDQLATLQRRLDALEAGRSNIVPSAPPEPPAEPRSINIFTDFQAELVEQTRPVPQNFKNESKPYNYPLRWFVRSDGDIVQLQGDPQSVSYYTDKGYRLLSKDQVERWLGGERAKVVAQQRKKAQLVGGIRRQVALDPKLVHGLDTDWDADLADMQIPELEALWDNLVAQSDQPRATLPRLQRLLDADQKRQEAADSRLLKDVDTSANMTREELEHKVRGGSGRDVEITSSTSRRFI